MNRYCFECHHICNDFDGCDGHNTTEVDDLDIYLAGRYH